MWELFALCPMGSLPIRFSGRKQDWETAIIEGMHTWLLWEPDVCTVALKHTGNLMTF